MADDESFAAWVRRVNQQMGDDVAAAVQHVDVDAARLMVRQLARAQRTAELDGPGGDAAGYAREVGIYALRLCREVEALRLQVAAQGDVVSVADVVGALRTKALKMGHAAQGAGSSAGWGMSEGMRQAAAYVEQWAAQRGGGAKRPDDHR